MMRCVVPGPGGLSAIGAVLIGLVSLTGCVTGSPESLGVAFPTPDQAAALTARARNHNSQWSEFDQDRDDQLNVQEWHARQWARYILSDVDGSGDLDVSEWVNSLCPYSNPPDEFYIQCRRYVVGQFQLRSRNGRVNESMVRQQSLNFFRQNDDNQDGKVSRAEYQGGSNNADE